MKITLKTLTPLWTGGIDGKVDRLHETGIIGSLRWWYEALVRGLGGYACDPTSDDRCPDEDGKHCVACELFGCTGWARKFRLQTPAHLETIQFQKNLKAIKEGQEIQLELIPLRRITDEEWCLLQMTLRLISDYGAMGGKTVFKPSDERNREQAFHHLDFGLVEIQTEHQSCAKTLDEIRSYVNSDKWRKGDHKYRDKEGKVHDYSWASLSNFWCVKGKRLARQSSSSSTFNKVIGRREDKTKGQQLAQNDRVSIWLAGSQQESKKVFSFRYPQGRRTFGFVKPGLIDFDEMKKRLQDAWGDFNPEEEFLTGGQIIRDLFSSKGGTQ